MLPSVLAGTLLAAAATGCSIGVEDEPAPVPANATGSWRQLPEAPLSAREDAVVVAVGDRVLVVGGWEFSCPPNADCSLPTDPLLGDGAVYDATADSWTTIAPPPFGLRRAEGTAVGLDDTAYLITTCADGPACGAPRRLVSYRLAEDRWTDHGPIPDPTPASRRVTALDRTLLVYSGSDERGEVADLVFDPERATWTELPDDPLPDVFDRFVVPVGDQLVLAGSAMNALGAGDRYAKEAARFDLRSGQWTPLPDAPGQGFRLLPSDRGPLLDGHYSGPSGWILDPGTWRWTALPELPGEYDDISGVLGREQAAYDVHGLSSRPTVYDSGTDAYVTIPPPPGHEDVHGESSSALGRDLFVFGGQRSTSGPGDDELVGTAWLWTAPTG